MRSCAYCGKELAPGEVCDCPMSVAKRKGTGNEKRENTTHEKAESAPRGNPYENANSYRTGYTGQESRAKRAWNKHKIKRHTERASSAVSGGFFRRLWTLTARTMRSPAESVMSPPRIDIAAIIIIAAVMGAVLRMCVFFAATGLSRSPFGLLAILASFGGAAGYRTVANGLLTALMGAASGVILFALYSGIFYLIGRLIMRSASSFRAMSERLIITCIPMTVICLAGLLLAMISTSTLIILAVCGILCTAILTYEALRNEWAGSPSGKVLYASALGLFIFISIIYSLLMIGRGI